MARFFVWMEFWSFFSLCQFLIEQSVVSDFNVSKNFGFLFRELHIKIAQIFNLFDWISRMVCTLRTFNLLLVKPIKLVQEKNQPLSIFKLAKSERKHRIDSYLPQSNKIFFNHYQVALKKQFHGTFFSFTLKYIKHKKKMF